MEKRDHAGKTVGYYALLLALLIIGACNRPDTLLDRASINLRLGDYHRARAGFEAVIDLHPENAPARLGLGKALLQAYTAEPGDSTLLLQSLTQLEAARTLAPGLEVEKLLSVCWFRRANHLAAQGDTLAALQALSRSTSLDPSAVKPVNLAGMLYFHRGDREKALGLFRKVIAMDSVSVSGYFNTGMVYWADGDYRGAYDCFFQAAKRSPGDREVLSWAASAKQRIGPAAP